MIHSSVRLLASVFAAAGCLIPVWAGTLVVTVVGVKDDVGLVGCALFAADAASSFPLDISRAVIRRAPAREGRMRCEFTDLPAGTYAVSASHDRNGNGVPDRNFVGLPLEPWAVSNNIRPTLRAPRFAEAALTLGADETKPLELLLAQ